MTSTSTEKLFLEHLADLRKSLLKSIVVLLLCFGVCTFFAKEIYHYLTQPLLQALPENSHFIATHPIEAWLTYLKVGLLAGFFLSSPLIFYQIWRFASPGLIKKEKTYTISFVLLSSLFFIGGALFGYFFVFPYGFTYFVSILDGTPIQFLPQMKDSFAFVARLLLAFGLVFELPLLVFFLAISRIVSLRALWNFQKYLIVLALLVAAILTPPDVITQVMMALPIVILYQLGILVAWIFVRKDKQT